MPKKILLAEDSLTIQKVFELTFAQSDFVLTMVDNGTDAVRLASEISPDLVVADVTLPGRNGFEVAGDLAASGVSRSCPVLILSGSLGPFDEESFKNSGARGVLFKPFESQELIDKVNEMLSAADAASAEVKGESPAPGTEEWDFSDVLEEVEDGHGVIGGVAVGATADIDPLSLGEFDVSVDELDGAGAVSGQAPPAETPAGIIDISPALAAVEALEEIEDLEEMELLHKESEGPLAIEPVLESEIEYDGDLEAIDEDLEAIIEELPAAADLEVAAVEALREQFSERARAIVEKVASEAVEKVMWEWMERLSAEFTERIRLSVESVAWDVIPKTAEALIREEITRIRNKEGNQGESK